MVIQENIAIAQLTTMRLGGAARYLIQIDNATDLSDAYAFARDKDIPTYILGDGSNVICSDKGFSGAVLLNRLKGIEVLCETPSRITLRVATGEQLDDLAAYAVAGNWCGVEALTEIPGTVGGAVMQNAGAYGQEISQVLLGVDAYDIKQGEFVHIPVDDMDLCYRHSIFNSDGPSSARGKYFLTAAHIHLHREEIQGELYGSLQAYLSEHEIDGRSAKTIRDAVKAIRISKLPDSATMASSGSFFKNITVDESELKDLRMRFPGIPIFLIGNRWEIPSGWLIEQAGLKGKLLHGMRVSEKAALILINESADTYENLSKARTEIAAAVKDKFGFELEQEPEEM